MMSTRSGKRIHSSISENIESLSEIRIERNTRIKRGKENSGEVATDTTKNFVRRPSSDEVESTQHETENSSKSVRKSRRQTLKALNTPAVDYDALNDRKSIRRSRRTQKEGTVQQTNLFIQETIEVGKEKKKNKKKKAVNENLENEPVTITKKKNNRKKRKSNSFIVEELVTEEHNKSFNKSNVSVDSFHSAAGSPGKIKDDNLHNIGKHKDRKESSTVTSYSKNGKGSKKKSKKTEKNNYFETSINKSVKLSASNESFESSVNKKEEITVKDVNVVEKENSGTFKTNSKQKRSKELNYLSDTENTHTITESIPSMEFHNSIDSNIHSTDLETTNEKNKIINTSTSNLDFINIPQVKGTNYGLESVSPLNNSSKKKRKSNSKNSTSDKINTSLTLLNKCNKEISDTIIETKIQLDDGTMNNTTRSEKPRKSKSQDATYEKINLSDTIFDKTFDKTNNSFNKNSNSDKKLSHNKRSSRRESSIKNTTYDKIDDNAMDISNNSNAEANSTAIKSRRSSRVSFPQGVVATVLNGTYDKISKDDSSFCNNTYDKLKSDTTFERSKDNLDGDNTRDLNPKPSLISSDNTDSLSSDMSENCSRISITSDDSRTDNIVNTTPLLIESSMDESLQKKEDISKIITPDKQSASGYNKTPPKQEESFSETKVTPLKRDGTYTELRKTPSKHRTSLTEREDPTPTLKREGTFIKESPDVTSPKSKTARTPTRRDSLPSPGRTPFSSSRSGSRGRVTLNVTHSIEKPQRRSSVAAAAPRLTRVMFCSPVDNPVAVAQMKGKIIKSNLKGSSKSFMFDESAPVRGGPRRRSRTQASAPAAARPRTTSAAARLQAPVETEGASPLSKSSAKPRTKLPNFAALHRKQFSKMESLDECQRRRARRARALLTPTKPFTPTAPVTPTASFTPIASLTPIVPNGALHGKNPKETSDTAQTQAEKRGVTQKKDIDKKNQSYTRFGFKLNLDVNPFSVPAKTADIHPKEVIKPKHQVILPSLAGTTQRKEAARQAVMREKSFTDKRNVDRNQNRTVIKGVRTNRRFELQMKMRNID